MKIDSSKVLIGILIILVAFLVYRTYVPEVPNTNGPTDGMIWTLGPDDAPVKITEWSDFECPYCQGAFGSNQQVMNALKQNDPTWVPAIPVLNEFAKNGKVQLTFKHFPLSGHRNAQKAAEAAECAGAQGKFWEMHDKLFSEGVTGGVFAFKNYAAQLELNIKKFNECLDSGATARKISADNQEGQQNGISATPGFLVNGKLVKGAQSGKLFEQIVNQIAG